KAQPRKRSDLGPDKGTRLPMSTIGEALDGAISSVVRLRKSLSNSKPKQVAAHDEVALVKATVFAWFNTCRPLMKALSGNDLLRAIESQYQAILNRRWNEAWSCFGVGALLASTVMMGAIPEALLLARINKQTDKSGVFSSKCAPKDKASG